MQYYKQCRNRYNNINIYFLIHFYHLISYCCNKITCIALVYVMLINNIIFVGININIKCIEQK
jgi:hypothetical protein